MSQEYVEYTGMFSQEVSNKSYPFKRDFYAKLKDTIQNSFVTALLGPRKCGKTIAL